SERACLVLLLIDRITDSLGGLEQSAPPPDEVTEYPSPPGGFSGSAFRVVFPLAGPHDHQLFLGDRSLSPLCPVWRRPPAVWGCFLVVWMYGQAVWEASFVRC